MKLWERERLPPRRDGTGRHRAAPHPAVQVGWKLFYLALSTAVAIGFLLYAGEELAARGGSGLLPFDLSGIGLFDPQVPTTELPEAVPLIPTS